MEIDLEIVFRRNLKEHTEYTVMRDHSIDMSEEEGVKEPDDKEKLKRWREEQVARELREEARREEAQRRRLEELAYAEKANELTRLSKQEAKTQLHLQEQAKRQKRLEAMKAQAMALTTPVSTSTPYAHVNLAGDFYRRMKVPDIEKEQELKAQRRLLQKSPTMQDLKAHARKYAQRLHEQQEKNREEMRQRKIDFKLQEINVYPQTHAHRDLLARDEEARAQANREAEQRRLLRLRQQHYALLVKEMFVPSTKPSDTPRSLPKPSITPKNKKKVYVPRPKLKVTSSLPTLPQYEKKEVVVKDYLSEMKQMRASTQSIPTEYDTEWIEELKSETAPAEQLQRLRSKAFQLDRQLRQAETQLQLSNPASLGVLEATQKLSDSLVANIQAKLRLLQV